MKNIITFIFVLTLFGCAGGPSLESVEGFKIVGTVYDDDTDEEIEGVYVTARGVGWKCSDETDEDGYYEISTAGGCQDLEQALMEALLSSSKTSMSVEVTFISEDHVKAEEGISWKLKERKVETVEVGLEPLESGGGDCGPGEQYIPALDECCKTCPPRYYNRSNCECAKIPDSGDTVDAGGTTQFIEINVSPKKVRIECMSIDNLDCDDSEGILDWDEEESALLIVYKDDTERELIINYEFNGDDQQQIIRWISSSAKPNQDLTLKWDKSEKVFKANWSVE